MKICLVEDFFPPAISGGASVYVGRLAETLAQAGHQVSVITTQPWRGWRSLFFTREQRHGLTVYSLYPWLFNIPLYTKRISRLAKPWTLLMYLGNPFVFWQYTRLLRRLNPDVVHTHDTIYLSLSIFPAIRSARVPQVHTGHYVHFIAPLGLQAHPGRPTRPSAPWQWRPFIPLVRTIVGQPRTVIALSRFYLAVHQRYGFFMDSAIERITTAMDPADNQLAGLAARGPRIMYAGRLDPEKGVADVISAFRQLQIPAAELLICGAGKSEAELRQAAGSDTRIKFLGSLDKPTLAKYFRQSRIVVLASYAQEILPLSIIEGYSHGTPAVCTDTGGSPDIVRDGENGFLFAPGDIATLGQRLHQLLTDDALWNRFHQQGRRTYADLQPDRHRQRLEAIYAATTQHPKPSRS